MDYFTIEFCSNASFNCYPINSLCSFTNFLPEQILLKEEWEVLFQKYHTLRCTKILHRESLHP